MATSNERAAELLQLAAAEFTDIDQYPAELKLIEAAATGHEAKYGSDFPWTSDKENADTKSWGREREVRANVIRWLCVNQEAKSFVDPAGTYLSGARVSGALTLKHVKIPFPLRMVRCRLPDKVDLIGCQIPRLDLRGGWTGPIDADSASVKDSVFLSEGFRADGPVSLVVAHIGGTLECSGGAFMSGSIDGDAISADGLKTGRDVFLRAGPGPEGSTVPFRANGTVRLIGAKIGGVLDCSGGEFLHAGKDAVNLEGAEIKGSLFLRGDGAAGSPLKVEGVIDLQAASTRNLVDDRRSWPTAGQLKLEGFTYDSFQDGPKDARSRLQWLKLDTASDGTRSYRQLAKILETSGDTKGADRVLEAMEAKLAGKNDWRAVRWLRASVGYGYRPGLALLYLAILTALGWLLYWYGDLTATMTPFDKDAYVTYQPQPRLVAGTLPGHYPRFHPLIYSLENTFPLVKLGQVDKWQPDPASDGYSGFLRVFIWIQIVLGWLFATLFVAGISGIIQHG